MSPRRMTRAEALALLRAQVYDHLPAIECKGLCADSCTIIDASELEREVLRDKHGVELPPAVSHQYHLRLIEQGREPKCPALGPLGNCTVYADRPLVCRLFGLAEGLLCEHGCVPDAVVPKPAVMQAFVEVEALSKYVTGVSRDRAVM